MHFAPAEWLIQLVALLPDALRPGVLLGLSFGLVWFVFMCRGLPGLLRGACRTVAVGVNLLLALLLLPEYLLTRARRAKGKGPGPIAIALVPIAANIQRLATGTYDRLTPKPPSKQASDDSTDTRVASPSAAMASQQKATGWTLFPWVLAALIVLTCTAAYVLMEQLPGTAPAKATLAEVFEYWRKVEGWADVDPSRRTAPGDPALPMLVSATYHPRLARMSVSCPSGRACIATVSIRTRFGTLVASQPVTLDADEHAVITTPLPHLSTTALHALHIDITRT
jgi:hypothetical protein